MLKQHQDIRFVGRPHSSVRRRQACVLELAEGILRCHGQTRVPSPATLLEHNKEIDTPDRDRNSSRVGSTMAEHKSYDTCPHSKIQVACCSRWSSPVKAIKCPLRFKLALRIKAAACTRQLPHRQRFHSTKIRQGRLIKLHIGISELLGPLASTNVAYRHRFKTPWPRVQPSSDITKASLFPTTLPRLTIRSLANYRCSIPCENHFTPASPHHSRWNSNCSKAQPPCRRQGYSSASSEQRCSWRGCGRRISKR